MLQQIAVYSDQSLSSQPYADFVHIQAGGAAQMAQQGAFYSDQSQSHLYAELATNQFTGSPQLPLGKEVADLDAEWRRAAECAEVLERVAEKRRAANASKSIASRWEEAKRVPAWAQATRESSQTLSPPAPMLPASFSADWVNGHSEVVSDQQAHQFSFNRGRGVPEIPPTSGSAIDCQAWPSFGSTGSKNAYGGSFGDMTHAHQFSQANRGAPAQSITPLPQSLPASAPASSKSLVQDLQELGVMISGLKPSLFAPQPPQQQAYLPACEVSVRPSTWQDAATFSGGARPSGPPSFSVSFRPPTSADLGTGDACKYSSSAWRSGGNGAYTYGSEVYRSAEQPRTDYVMNPLPGFRTSPSQTATTSAPAITEMGPITSQYGQRTFSTPSQPGSMPPSNRNSLEGRRP